MFENALSAEAVQEALEILQHEFPLALWETVYVTLLSTAFAIVLGLPLGILLVAGEPQGVLPLPKWLMRALNVLINLLRSVPFTRRNLLIIAVALGLSVGLNARPDTLGILPDELKLIFAETGVATATLVSIVLDRLLPKDKASGD